MSYQMRISICRISPEIWRRLKVPLGITFEQLHRIIQEAFGWQDYHLYKFQFGNAIITVPDEESIYDDDTVALDSTETGIDKFFSRHDKCTYTYDFGDGWEHEIVIEKMLPDKSAAMVPFCLGGARSRPPEDVGGPGGYADFLNIIKDKANPEREEYLDWARKDTKGRLFDPEYFYTDEVNVKLMHVLEDTRESSTELFTGRDGLKGELKFGFYGPYIETGKDKYSWDRIGDMLKWIDDGYDISIKVKERKNGIAKYEDNRKTDERYDNSETKTGELLLNALERAKAFGQKLEERRELKLWNNVIVPCNLKDTLVNLSKEESDKIRKNLDFKNLSSLKKADLASKLAELIPGRFEKILKLLDKSRYDIIKALVRNSGFISAPDMTIPQIESLMEYGITFPGIFNGKRVLYTPQELAEIFSRVDGVDLEKIIYRNTEWINLTHGYLYYYGVSDVWQIKEKISRITGQEIDFLEYMNVISFAEDYYQLVRFSQYGFREHRVSDPKKIIEEHKMRPEVDFYPFTKKQLLKAGRPDYIEKTPAMNNLISFLSEYYELDEKAIDEMAVQLNDMINMDAKSELVIEYLQSFLEFPASDDFLEELTERLADLHNNTRMWALKGHTPTELFQAEKKELMPIAPEYIKAVSKEPKVVDIRTREKVGRNDPCPCGSGKKYKKCCGK